MDCACGTVSWMMFEENRKIRMFLNKFLRKNSASYGVSVFDFKFREGVVSLYFLGVEEVFCEGAM
jgi:hypothetical protein